MLTVELRLSQPAARVFVESLQLFDIGFSWGGFESLVQLVTPGSWPATAIGRAAAMRWCGCISGWSRPRMSLPT